MQFSDEVMWSSSDFVVAAIGSYGALGAYKLLARLSSDSVFRAGYGFAIGGALMLLWVNLAVGLTDSAADGFYLMVVAMAAVGLITLRERPALLAIAMVATALAQALVGMVALAMGIVPAHNSPFQILGLAILFSAPFAISASFFRKAAQQMGTRDADINT